jgi:putative Holliday junction resolvase
MQRGRRIAFDYGDVRIGVAVSDMDSILVTPVEPLINGEDLHGELVNLFTEYEPLVIYVGEPKHLSGVESAKMAAVGDFVAMIAGITDTDVTLIDERLSTVSAAAKLRESGKNGRSSKGLIDSAAAAEILEAALNKVRLQGDGS